VDYSEKNQRRRIEEDEEERLENLHELGERLNPYQEILDMVARIFSVFGENPSTSGMSSSSAPDDEMEAETYPIHVFGFGDMSTKDISVFPFILSRNLTPQPCKGFNEVLKRYLQTTPNIIPSRPSSFGPVIRESIKLIKETNSYHVLVILTSGHIDNIEDTKLALKEASLVSLSIIVVGIGDGPFTQMYEFYQTPQRAFENYHFISVAQVLKMEHGGSIPKTQREVLLSCYILQEIPSQWSAIKKLGYPK